MLVTVTTVAEAHAAVEAGADGLVVQGSGAGGHSGTHDPHHVVVETLTEGLVRAIAADISAPLVAAGGVDGPDAVRLLLDAGAAAVAVGTLFLLADEAGTSPPHRAALVDPRFTETVMTHAFTGRPARALRNDFVDRHGAEAPIAYPAVHHLTRPMRQAAAAAGDSSMLHLWAGTGWRNARALPAGDIVRWLTPRG